MANDAPKQTLNVRSPKLKSDTDSPSLNKAVERKMLYKESFNEAWERILSMKNSEPDTRRLYEVKQAMETGEIERESESTAKRFSKAEALRLWTDLNNRRMANRLQEMVDNTPDNYWLITSKERLDDFLGITDFEDYIVFDVETTGTDVWEDHIVGHVLTAVEHDIHAYIPTRHEDERFQLDNDYVNEKLRPLYEDGQIRKVAHNAKHFGVVKPFSKR